MVFIPKLDTRITVQNSTLRFTEHPSAKNMPYGQMGKRATVYQVRNEQGKLLALKVFRKNFQTTDMLDICQRLAPFRRLTGLEVCQREVLIPNIHKALLDQYPDLAYAVLMPWVTGQTWFDVLTNRRSFTEQDSFTYAQLFAQMMQSLEQEGVAHCDLSGPESAARFRSKASSLSRCRRDVWTRAIATGSPAKWK